MPNVDMSHFKIKQMTPDEKRKFVSLGQTIYSDKNIMGYEIIGVHTKHHNEHAEVQIAALSISFVGSSLRFYNLDDLVFIDMPESSIVGWAETVPLDTEAPVKVSVSDG